MQKQSILLLICGLFILLNVSCKKNDPARLTLKDNLQKILDEHLTKYKAKFPDKTIGFGLYVKSPGGKIDYPNVYVSSGLPEAYGAAIHFRGASTTKSFTAAGILRLHQQGKLNIDHLITANIPGTNQPYIPNTSSYAIPYKDRITIRLLLQHRAGVFDVTNTTIPDTVSAPYKGKKYVDYVLNNQGGNHTFTLQEMVNVVAENRLSYFQPNQSFHYSNTGYHMLSTIIERISGKRYDQFMQDEFLTPLQLNHTRFPYLGTDQGMPDPYVNGWLLNNDTLTEVDNHNVSFIVGDGNIITTPADLVRWANALYGSNTILNPELHAQMITGIPTYEEHVNYGLGTELNPADIGYGHNGAHPAYMTIMRYHPATNASYVLFCNFLDIDGFADQGEDMGKNMLREAIRAVEKSR